MGIYPRFTTALTALFLFSLPAVAAVRAPISTTAQQVAKTAHAPSFQTPNGELAYFGADTYYDVVAGSRFSAGDSPAPTVRPSTSGMGSPQFPYGPSQALPGNGPDGSITRIKVQPKAVVPKAPIGTRLKNLVKTNPASIALNAAVAGAVAAVGWVMSDDNTKIQKKQESVGGITVSSKGNTFQLYEVCSLPAAQTLNKVVVTTVNGITYATGVWASNANGSFGGPSGYQSSNNCTDSSKGYWYNAQGYWPQSGYRVISVADIQTTKTDLAEADYGALDTYLAGRPASEWLEYQKFVCEQDADPAACYKATSTLSFSGPASAVGPSWSSTKSYTKPDGSTGTQVISNSTQYNFTYGPSYIDVNTTRTTTTMEDGQLVSTEITEDTSEPQELPPESESEAEEQYSFDDTDLPEVEPFYEQKYPDGFQGVWNEAKSDFDNSEFLSFLQSFVPSFSGTCPSWSMNFAIGAMANFGTIPFATLCYVFDFIKVIVLVTAAFTCRAIIFGG
ncbi:hypothetical protein D9M69_332240 [compost metagenome]